MIYFKSLLLSMGKFEEGYITCLQGSDLKRYKELIISCGGIDPYEVEQDKCVCDESLIPNINLVHIMNYLVNTTRSVSMNKMCNYNSSDGYRFCVDGWIQSIKFLKLTNGFILCLGEVKHSFRLREKNLKPWVLVKPEGDILTGWCTCKAGCGESCNHVSAILYALEIATKKKEALTSSSVPCYWLPPRLKDVPYARIRDIDFTPPAVKRMKIITGDQGPIQNLKPKAEVPPEALADFFQKLQLVQPATAIFRVHPDYCDAYVPKRVEIPTLKNLFDRAFCDLSLKDLRIACRPIFEEKIKISLEDSINIEKMTRGQSSCKTWFHVKIGRIGGSNIHSVMTTSINNPSLSSIHAICDPLRPQKKTKWMVLGTQNEDLARNAYINLMIERGHVNFKNVICATHT